MTGIILLQANRVLNGTLDINLGNLSVQNQQFSV
jgi:hypothetical protein